MKRGHATIVPTKIPYLLSVICFTSSSFLPSFLPSVLILASANLMLLKGSSRFTFQKKAALSFKNCAEI